ncbi:MAG: CHAT domain-containing protein [Anaerolineae bacterium]|jgi:hypothetical protein
MSRKADLEHSIRESYGIITEYEAIVRTSDRPEEKTRARRVIQEQWKFVKGYLTEYRNLAGDSFPPDIAEITEHFPDLVIKNDILEQEAGVRKAVIKILFLAANPLDTTQLRLAQEIRSIDQALRLAEFREHFDIRQHWAVRVADIQACLLLHKPDIVHFSGHGSESSEIILEDDTGNSHPVPVRALSELLSVLKDNIRCVVLNACYSEQQAQAIAKHVDCVIGMSKAIGDTAAISFVTAFYRGLAFGRDVKTAFDLGRVQIDLEGLDDRDTPKLLAMRHNPETIVFVA